ncbi:MAG: hypothetical protein ACI4TK_18355 [Agathobacter sp.]
MKCPKCGSEHVQFSTKTSGGGFSVFDSCCGYIIMGPLGLLCGACGSGTTTEEFWICHECGHKFSTESGREYLQKEANEAHEYTQNKAALSAAGDKTFEELEKALNETKLDLNCREKSYQELLDKHANGSDEQLRKYAKVLKRDALVPWAWIVLFLCGVITIAGGIVCLPFAVVSAVFLLIHRSKAKKAKAALSEADPEFGPAMEAVKDAEQKKEKAAKLHKAGQAVKDYEAKHREK